MANPNTGQGTDEGEETAATWTYFEAMHAAIGSRPSICPVFLYSSGPKLIDAPHQTTQEGQTRNDEELSSDVAGSSGMNFLEKSPVKRPEEKKNIKRSGDNIDGLMEWCEEMGRRQTEEDKRDREWLNHSQGQMDKMVDLLGKLVDHITK